MVLICRNGARHGRGESSGHLSLRLRGENQTVAGPSLITFGVVIVAKLNDRQKKQIIADRAQGLSLKKLAVKYGVSKTTIGRVCQNDPETGKKVALKKEQNTLDMLAYMDQQKEYAQDVLKNILVALNDPEKLKRANVRDLSTAFGIIVDKFVGTEPKNASDELLQKAKEILGGFDGVIK